MCIRESVKISWSEEQGLTVGGILLVAHVLCFLSFLSMRSAFVPSLNLTVTLFRAMVNGKKEEMYEELFQCFFRVAAANGLVAPRAEDGTDGRARPGRVPFVSATMDFEMAQHLGLFKAMARVFGGQPTDYHGRAIGCGVHFKRFLLKACGNNQRDPFFTRMVYLRDSEMERDMAHVRQELSTMAGEYERQGETKKANVIRWLLKSEVILMAAFPRRAGVLDKFELLAGHNDTNSCESLNRQTQQVVAEKGASTLLEVVSALSRFDHRTMAGLTTSGLVTPTGASQTQRMNRAATRKRRNNTVSASGQPPKGARRRRLSGKAAVLGAAGEASAAAARGGAALVGADGGVPAGGAGGEGLSAVAGGAALTTAAGGDDCGAGSDAGASAAASGGAAVEVMAEGGASTDAVAATAATAPAIALSAELLSELQVFLDMWAKAASGGSVMLPGGAVGGGPSGSM